MRVALVQCPVWGTREPPLALVQLSACLKSTGHETRSFDLNNFLYRRRNEAIKNLWAWEQSQVWYNLDDVTRLFQEAGKVIEDFADSVLAQDPRMVGFSVAASSLAASIAFARILRRKNPSLAIVFGGQLFFDRSMIDRVFDDAPVDYILADEADVTLPELAATLDRGGNPDSVAGIYVRRGGETRFTGVRPPLASLDDLPYMDFTDLRIEDYDDDRHILLMASRGCVWNCAFCSSRSFWDKYRYMSGERIHQEITYHKSLLSKDMSHVDFADLAFNGNMERVVDFCTLMEKYPPTVQGGRMQWISNAIIHPGLTPDVLALMHRSGCQRLIFGIESGSPRVLKNMRKMYNPEVAVRVIRDANAAGIKVTCNFMFGFPGETEEDFAQTLDFVRKIAGHVDRVYPSRTYFAMEQYSYIFDHTEEFGIKTPFNHHLYWESIDGTNTYPVRLKRCQRFEQLCGELGVTVDCGVRTSVEQDEWFNLAHYYEYLKDDAKAAEYFRKYAAVDPANEFVQSKLRHYGA